MPGYWVAEATRELNYRWWCRWEPLTSAAKHATPFIGPFPIQKDHLPQMILVLTRQPSAPLSLDGIPLLALLSSAGRLPNPLLYLSPPFSCEPKSRAIVLGVPKDSSFFFIYPISTFAAKAETPACDANPTGPPSALPQPPMITLCP